MSSVLVFAGSKRAARRRAAEQREVDRVTRDLNEIYQLAQSVRDEPHLQQILADVPDEAARAAVASVIRRFLPWATEAPRVE